MILRFLEYSCMPAHLSPIKRLRRDEKVRMRNKSSLSKLRTTIKKTLNVLSGSDHAAETISSSVRCAQSALAKTASKGVIHKKTASRKIGRLMKKMASLAVSSS